MQVWVYDRRARKVDGCLARSMCSGTEEQATAENGLGDGGYTHVGLARTLPNLFC